MFSHTTPRQLQPQSLKLHLRVINHISVFDQSRALDPSSRRLQVFSLRASYSYANFITGRYIYLFHLLFYLPHLPLTPRYLDIMVKRGSTTFLGTKVAKAGMAALAALTRILELEKEVGKLRHHVSVLSKRIHVMGKEAERKEGDKSAEVASPVRVQEPEPLVVTEPEVRRSGTIVADADEDVWVAQVAQPPVAESRVAVVMDGPEVAMVRLPKGKRRRVDEEEDEDVVSVEVEGSEAEGSGSEMVEVAEGGIIVASSIPVAPRGMQMVGVAPVGPRRGGQFGRGVVNPNFPMFFNHARRFAGDHEKWPVRRGGGYR